jgi:hypothetical protein
MSKTIVAIGTSPLDLIHSCFGVLSNFIVNKAKIHLIVLPDSGVRKGSFGPSFSSMASTTKIKDGAQLLQSCFSTFSTSDDNNSITVQVMTGFNYSTITQNNVQLLRSYTETVDPALVFIPFIGSKNKNQKILASSSLLAARSVKSILMYELSNMKNLSKDFVPNIFFALDKNCIHAKKSCIEDCRYYSNSKNSPPIAGRSKIRNREQAKQGSIRRILKALDKVPSTNALLYKDEYFESFQSHRLVLNSQEDPFSTGRHVITTPTLKLLGARIKTRVE